MTQTAKLAASDGAGGDAFGISIAVSGDTVVVGAYGKNGEIGAADVLQNGSQPPASVPALFPPGFIIFTFALLAVGLSALRRRNINA
jgi:hypothetical protein